MNWNSTVLMTIFGVIVLGVIIWTLLSIWRCRKAISEAQLTYQLGGLAIGICALGLFYFADLVTMSVLPLILIKPETMEVIRYLHLNVSWIISVIAVFFLAFSASLICKHLLALNHKLDTRNEIFRAAFERSRVGLLIRDQKDRSVISNSGLENMLGYSAEEFRRINLTNVMHPRDRRKNRETREALLASNLDNYQITSRYYRKDGRIVWLTNDSAVIKNNDGQVTHTIAVFQDITERRAAEREAAEKSNLLEATFQNMVQGVAVFDRHDTLKSFNRQYGEILELPENFLHVGLNRREIGYWLRRGDFESTQDEGLIESKLTSFVQREFGQQILPSGRTYIANRASLPDGGYIVTVTDVTKIIESEKKLLQAQKMEAVGQLTGGIAHDFNNLLAVSLGNVELGEEIAKRGGDVQPYLATIKRANQRGAALTNQLLAFSRKQTLQSEIIDTGELVSGIGNLLRRTLGETIEVDVLLDDNLWKCNVDPNQFESAILNLAVNARDAMPNGGKLSILAKNVHVHEDSVPVESATKPGDYVLVSVTDTGSGIPKELTDQIFEPFFTTKDVGCGSGLGLSMVYGFVKQSHGYVQVESEEGKGTTFNLCFPRSEEAQTQSSDSDQQVQPSSSRDETVLVVEDDQDVRKLSVKLLNSLGYVTVEAADSESALKVLHTTQKIDLLFTDVVLPGGMSGPELAEEVRRQRPGLPIVFTSGYTELADFDQSLLNRDNDLLRKPFRRVHLAEKVRSALDQEAHLADCSADQRAISS